MSMLSVIILTKNEEKHIVDVVKNAFQVADEVLIVDSGSTDRTVELAKENGARVVFRAWDNDFSAQRNFGLKNTDADWVIHLDADERLNDELIKSIKDALNEPYQKPTLYSFVRKNTSFGKHFRYGVLGPEKKPRMHPRTLGYWTGSVHEHLECMLPNVLLDGAMEHSPYKDLDQYINKMNFYSSIGADKLLKAGKRSIFIRDLVLRPSFAFIKMYIFKLGFLEGWLGFVTSIVYANYTFTKYAKLRIISETKK